MMVLAENRFGCMPRILDKLFGFESNINVQCLEFKISSLFIPWILSFNCGGNDTFEMIYPG